MQDRSKLPANWKAKKVILVSISMLFLAVGRTCGAVEETTLPPIPGYPLRIEFPGVGKNGIFDASLVEDEVGQNWMSYSVVNFSPIAPKLTHVQTRIAVSADEGMTWQDRGIINLALVVTLPPPNQDLPAVWEQEVSGLIFNPYMPASQRWQIIWPRFLRAYDLDQYAAPPLIEHGWIAWKSASTPEGPWSNERELFSGNIYNETNNSDPTGAPEYRLDRLFPSNAALGNCLVFSEPGAFVTEEGLYISLKCPTGAVGGKIVLLRCAHDLLTCDYRGNMPDDEDTCSLNSRHNGSSASEMFPQGEDIFLMVTPTQTKAKLYRRAISFESSISRMQKSNASTCLRKIFSLSRERKAALTAPALMRKGATQAAISTANIFLGLHPNFASLPVAERLKPPNRKKAILSVNLAGSKP